MAKKLKEQTTLTNDEFEEALKSEPQVFDSLTMGIVPRKEGGFNIIKISVDSNGLEAGEVEVIDTAENKAEANEKFKINVVRLGIL